MPHCFLEACHRRPVDHIPVWIMRQAGRFLPSYRALRAEHSFWDMVSSPELTAKATLLPIDEIGVDAAILFSDILVPFPSMGRPVLFQPAPSIADPVRTSADVDSLKVADPADFPWQADGIRACKEALEDRVPLIGFCGAPFTVAAYLVEGGGSKSFAAFKSLFYQDRPSYDRLMEIVTESLIATLNAQIEAGADAVQVFESWASLVGPGDFADGVLPWVRRLIEGVRRPGLPIIYYANGASGYLELLSQSGADVIGVDWRVTVAEAAQRIAPEQALQGNLDPTSLALPIPKLEARVRELVRSVAHRPGYIFNLGHGILPGADPAHLKAAVAAAQSIRPQQES